MILTIHHPYHISIIQIKKDVCNVNVIGKLEKLLLEGKITEEEYRKKKAVYIETILEMYCMDLITKEEMQERLNK